MKLFSKKIAIDDEKDIYQYELKYKDISNITLKNNHKNNSQYTIDYKNVKNK